jgi:OOP family OmpA-OmpF porin
MKNIRTSFTGKTVIQAALAAIVGAVAFAPTAGIAQSQPDANTWHNPSGSVLKNSTGLCWRSGSWTAADATVECDGLVAKAEAPFVSPPAAAEPAPLLALAPVMQTRKITFSSEEWFDFDKAELRPEGKDALNKLTAELNGVDYQVVTVNGHTDRIGGTAYNQKLSERRAHAVQAYLVSSQIKSDRITWAGMGENQPITNSGECPGPMSKKLVACLQPDRRVEVEVQGAKEVTLTR